MALEGVDKEGAALLVIDMQGGSVADAGIDAERLAAVVANQKRLIERCQEAAIPVIWTVAAPGSRSVRSRNRRAAPTGRPKGRPAAVRDDEIVGELKALAAVDPSRVIGKLRQGAFYQTRLDVLLRQLATHTLFVAGIPANGAVDTSIREAFSRDYDVVAVTDCIASENPAWQKAAEEVWERHLCALHGSADVLAWIDAQSGPRVIEFVHMILKVGDIEASRHFYHDLLGFTPRPAIPLADGRPVVPFRQGIALTAGSPGGPPQIDHMAFRVSDVRAIVARLKAARVKFFDDLHDGVYGLTIYVADPDGNKVELFQSGATVG
jgi:nicotinamidase-related amidase/catechol 2,3-dioxygenase-like lactoylglutathione lyase family enzyme